MIKWSTRLLILFSWTGIILALSLCLVTIFKLIPSSVRERDFQRQRIAFLESQLKETERSIKIKRKFLKKINTNPEFLERVAREKLKFVRPNETVIQIQPKDSSSF